MIVFRNSVNVEGATHRQVVELIRQGGDRLQLVVISVGNEVMDDEIYAEEQMPNFRYDYTDKRSLPITIPNFQYIQVCLF